MILVDSSVWIDYFNGNDITETKKLDLYLGVQPIAIGDVILTEVLQGFKDDQHYQTAKNLLTSLTVYNLLGINLAIKSAENYRFLRKKGITVRKTNDVIIATFCLENNLPLLFCDRDFKPFVTHLNLISA
jgi:predicted nucleic acid-binding protein